jgi:putative sterol carrier protein
MRSRSAGFDAAVTGGGVRVQRAYAINSGLSVEVPLLDFSVTADRSQVARYSGTVSLAETVNRALVHAHGARIQVWDGFIVGGTEELMPVLTGRIQSVDQSDSGEVVVHALGLEKAVEDARFVEPLVVEGSGITIMSYYLGVYETTVSVRTARDAIIPRIVYERERWAMYDGDSSIARSLGVEVFFDASGAPIIANVPTINDPPVWTVAASTVLVGFSTSESRDGVYSVVVAESDRVTENGVRAIVQADDLVNSDFGYVTRFYASPALGTLNQAESAAASLLADSRGLARSLSFTTAPNPALEPGDVVIVVFPDGTQERHLIDSITHSRDGVQSAQTRTTNS